MNLIRTFHPIGQGAFYSERHFSDNKEFTIVYDCGSNTLDKQKLQKKIKSSFPYKQQIDILFISHFHEDHINGLEFLIKHCKVKRVVLPLLDEDSKTLIKVSNFIESNYTDTRLLDDANDFFGSETSVISINPAVMAGNENSIDIEARIDISTITSPNIRYPSGTVFIPFQKVEWMFIPFNYKQSIRKTQFIEALKDYDLQLTDIDSINKISKYKGKITKAYRCIDGDLNENSMVLFSGKKDDDDIFCFVHYHDWFYRYFLDIRFRCGCLYMGDVDLNEPNLISDLQGKLGKLFSTLGTLQIPHHGSLHNFEKSILNSDIRCAILSFGTTNTYGHPSDRVIGELIANKVHPHLVTEEQLSMVTQWK